MAPSRDLSPVSNPFFVVINGRVHMQMSGLYCVFEKGQSVSFERHGGFLIEYTAETYGIVQNTTRSGRVQPVFIPPEKGCLISNGIWNFYPLNYQSWRDACSLSYLRIGLYSGQRGKLRDSDSMVGPPIGPFYCAQERESWRGRFEGQFRSMQARLRQTFPNNDVCVMCEATDRVPQLPPQLRSFQKPTPEKYVGWLEGEMNPHSTPHRRSDIISLER